MPFYRSTCKSCGAEHEFVRSIATRKRTPKCCGKKTDFTIGTPQIAALSTKTGWAGLAVNDKKFESGSQMMKHLDKNNLVPAAEAKKRAAEVRQQKEADYDRKLTATVDRVVNQHFK